MKEKAVDPDYCSLSDTSQSDASQQSDSESNSNQQSNSESLQPSQRVTKKARVKSKSKADEQPQSNAKPALNPCIPYRSSLLIGSYLLCSNTDKTYSWPLLTKEVRGEHDRLQQLKDYREGLCVAEPQKPAFNKSLQIVPLCMVSNSTITAGLKHCHLFANCLRSMHTVSIDMSIRNKGLVTPQTSKLQLYLNAALIVNCSKFKLGDQSLQYSATAFQEKASPFGTVRSIVVYAVVPPPGDDQQKQHLQNTFRERMRPFSKQEFNIHEHKTSFNSSYLFITPEEAEEQAKMLADMIHDSDNVVPIVVLVLTLPALQTGYEFFQVYRQRVLKQQLLSDEAVSKYNVQRPVRDDYMRIWSQLFFFQMRARPGLWIEDSLKCEDSRGFYNQWVTLTTIDRPGRYAASNLTRKVLVDDLVRTIHARYPTASLYACTPQGTLFFQIQLHHLMATDDAYSQQYSTWDVETVALLTRLPLHHAELFVPFKYWDPDPKRINHRPGLGEQLEANLLLPEWRKQIYFSGFWPHDLARYIYNNTPPPDSEKNYKLREYTMPHKPDFNFGNQSCVLHWVSSHERPDPKSRDKITFESVQIDPRVWLWCAFAGVNLFQCEEFKWRDSEVWLKMYSDLAPILLTSIPVTSDLGRSIKSMAAKLRTGWLPLSGLDTTELPRDQMPELKLYQAAESDADDNYQPVQIDVESSSGLVQLANAETQLHPLIVGTWIEVEQELAGQKPSQTSAVIARIANYTVSVMTLTRKTLEIDNSPIRLEGEGGGEFRTLEHFQLVPGEAAVEECLLAVSDPTRPVKPRTHVDSLHRSLNKSGIICDDSDFICDDSRELAYLMSGMTVTFTATETHANVLITHIQANNTLADSFTFKDENGNSTNWSCAQVTAVTVHHSKMDVPLSEWVFCTGEWLGGATCAVNKDSLNTPTLLMRPNGFEYVFKSNHIYLPFLVQAVNSQPQCISSTVVAVTSPSPLATPQQQFLPSPVLNSTPPRSRLAPGVRKNFISPQSGTASNFDEWFSPVKKPFSPAETLTPLECSAAEILASNSQFSQEHSFLNVELEDSQHSQYNSFLNTNEPSTLPLIAEVQRKLKMPAELGPNSQSN